MKVGIPYLHIHFYYLTSIMFVSKSPSKMSPNGWRMSEVPEGHLPACAEGRQGFQPCLRADTHR
jgi:hypothetical protein